MTKKARLKFQYLENEKSFQDEIKMLIHHFQRAFFEVSKTFFLEGESSTFKAFTQKKN